MRKEGWEVEGEGGGVGEEEREKKKHTYWANSGDYWGLRKV